MAERLNIVVGITGGIAAYKAVNVIREFVRAGHDVHVVASEAALEFVGRPTLEALSRNEVHTDLYADVAQVRHVAIGQAADLMVIAPATANTLAKLAAGIANDLLTTTVLACRAPLVVAPAMHTEMWEHPATVANVATLRARGVHIVGPEIGALTGPDSGPGRMSEPGDIVAAALAVVGPRDLDGLRVLVSAGGTREPIDPVRFIGNRSSGRQGLEVAIAARNRGAVVTLVAAHLEVPVPSGVEVVEAGTAEELRLAMLTRATSADVVVMAAAVADYRPVRMSHAKLRKEEVGDELTVELVKNPDILRDLVESRRPGQTIVGFAAETETDRERLMAIARAKAARKGADALVVNRVSWTEGFGAAVGNAVTVIGRDGRHLVDAEGPKSAVAGSVLDVIVQLRSADEGA